MNKKCGKCGQWSDKCKNPNNIHYNKFREKEDRCSNKTIPVHYYWWEYDKEIPDYIDKKGCKSAICGYLRENIERRKEKVTCKLCIREMKKRGIIKSEF